MIVLGDEEIEVKSWRDVVFQFALFAAKFADDFSTVAETSPEYFSTDPARATLKEWRALPNGWYVYVKISANTAVQLCERIALAIGRTSND